MTTLTYNVIKGGLAMLNFEFVANRFSELRNKSGLTQSIIAEYLGVDQSYISKCEKGERQFSVEILDKAAELFGCTVDYFVNESSEFSQMPIALRAKSVTIDDLGTIATMNKIALNLRYMEDLLEGDNT
jgi:transcriptional regulator with XRE-family HTH domain